MKSVNVLKTDYFFFLFIFISYSKSLIPMCFQLIEECSQDCPDHPESTLPCPL